MKLSESSVRKNTPSFITHFKLCLLASIHQFKVYCHSQSGAVKDKLNCCDEKQMGQETVLAGSHAKSAFLLVE